MRLTRSSVVLAVLGVLLLVAAAVVRFVVVPSATKLPDDLNTTQEFEGTYNGLNPAALAGGGGQLLLRDVPMTASRTYTVDSSDGDTAVVKRTVERAIAGQAEPRTETLYAVDRTDFESAPAPSGAGDVVDSEGLIFTLPLDPATDADYQLWDQTTQAAYPLTYKDTSTLEGRTVLEYRVGRGGRGRRPGGTRPAHVGHAAAVDLAAAGAGGHPPAASCSPSCPPSWRSCPTASR